MAEGIFIKTSTLKKNTIIDGSVDPDLFVQYIYLAQDIHIQNYLGTQLYERLQEGVIADDLTADETLLIDKYIQPALIHYAMAEYLPFAAYKVAQGGVFKYNGEASFQSPKDEVDRLVSMETSYAENYAQRLVDYLRYNEDLYPLYNANQDENIDPSYNVFRMLGWKIGGDGCKPKKRTINENLPWH